MFLKVLKKILGLIEYKLINKNLIKNDLLVKLVEMIISNNFEFFKLEENIICIPKDRDIFKNLF